jgi:hypothetical protein
MIRARISWIRPNIFLVARPLAVIHPVAAQRLGGRSARLVERGDESRRRGLRSWRSFQFWSMCSSLLSSAGPATPGSVRPSIHSRKAPPAVETKLKSSATPAWLSAATVSPPPATETSCPPCQRRRGRASARWRHRTAGSRTRPAARSRPGSAGLEHIGQGLDRRRADVEDHLVGLDLVDVAGAQ